MSRKRNVKLKVLLQRNGDRAAAVHQLFPVHGKRTERKVKSLLSKMR